jgi:hypothetical protein
VTDTAGAIQAVRDATVDPAAWDAFIATHLGAVDGGASRRVVEILLGGDAVRRRGGPPEGR